MFRYLKIKNLDLTVHIVYKHNKNNVILKINKIM